MPKPRKWSHLLSIEDGAFYALLSSMDTFPKRCACCSRTYQDLAEFLALGLTANGVAETRDEWARCAWRNCTCGSTLCVELERFRED